MTEWWTYGLSDFILFSPRTYYRLLERHNVALWPGHILALGLGLVVAGLLRRPTASHQRVVPALLAVLWAWVAWAFLWNRYATINWAAVYIVPLFAVEVLLLIWISVVHKRLSWVAKRDAAGVIGLMLFIVGLALYPALAPLIGRPWQQAEVFGVAPDPTAIATLGLLLLAQGRPRWELMAVPVIWCVLSGATLWALGSPEAWIPPLAAGLSIVVSVWRRSG
ncbi:MAG TPA: DUF6064 family protein [Gemmatimonadales bacterium]|nr:DUF6064 family protein [Gemmatimonadales bacterium]